MSSPFSVKLPDVTKIVDAATQNARNAIITGTRSAARRVRANLVRKTPKDTGLMKAAWQDTASLGPQVGKHIVTVFNSAPYAGIIEEGARPHPVSQAGRESIALWVRRNIIDLEQTDAVDAAEAIEKVVDAIVHKLERYGQKGTFFVRNMLKNGFIDKAMRAEINRHLAKVDPKLTLARRGGK